MAWALKWRVFRNESVDEPNFTIPAGDPFDTEAEAKTYAEALVGESITTHPLISSFQVWV